MDHLASPRAEIPREKTALAFLLAGIPLSGTTMLYNRALETLPASLAVIFLFQSIWLGTLAECMIRREKPTRIRLLPSRSSLQALY